MKLIGLALLLPAVCLSAPTTSPANTTSARLKDFDQMVSFVRAKYAWPERIDLDALAAAFRPKIAKADLPDEFHRLMEDFLDGCGDAHSHLGSNRQDSWCLPPGQVAAEWRDGKAMVAAVWHGSAAEKAGMRPGMEILRWNGKPLEAALLERAPHLPSPMHEDQNRWRLNALLAGRHDQGCRLTVMDRGLLQEINIPPGDPVAPPLPESRLLEKNIGIIAFQELGSEAQVERMDAALARFPKARAWILDLRGLRVGGDTTVVLPIMGRFMEKAGVYAWMQRRNGQGLGKAWPEKAMPRGKVFHGPLVILVDPWTASAAEGLAMGLSGLGRAKVVGTRMAGLGAAVHSITLRHSGLRVQISTEPIFDAQQRPRTAFQPDIAVDLAQPGDPILEAGLREVQRSLASK